MNSRATINHGAASRRRGNPGARLKPALWRKNGNCTGYTSAGGNVTDTWDAEDRLATVTKGGTLSTFSYDGYSRCIQIVESTSGTVTATKRFVWDGATRCEERNANNNVIERFFPEGEQISGVNYFYTHDRLGSVREVTSASGSILADYAYDAFGNQTLLDGTPIGDVGYAGYFYHANSGLNLTLYRAYDPDAGRWLSRDPMGERGGLNLYGYVGNSPIDEVDSMGLSGGTFYSSHPHPDEHYGPMFNSPFSFGIQVTVAAEAGISYGAGGNYTWGFGLFYNPATGFSAGGFQSGGVFSGGPPASLNIPDSPSCTPSSVWGSAGGIGIGPWISNAGSPSDLGGPFDQTNYNTEYVSGSAAEAGGISIYSASFGTEESSTGASFSRYPTTTWSAGGYNLSNGQPNVYVPGE